MGSTRLAGGVRIEFWLIVCISVLWLYGCAPTPREFVLDSPEHRLTNGLRLLELGRVEDARYEFGEALRLDPSCCAALRGIAISLGLEERFEKAFELMNQAKSCAKDPRDKSMAAVGFMRLNELQKANGWFKRTEKFFDEALRYFPENSYAYYYMGIACGQAGLFPKALWAFEEAAKIGGPIGEKAEQRLNSVKKVIQAKPVSTSARNLALKEVLTRGDVAVLFIRELQLDKIYRERGIPFLDESNKGFSLPQDVSKHPYKKEITKVLHLGIQGLTLLPGGGFGPNLQVTRSEFATMIADILRNIRVKDSAEAFTGGREVVFADISKKAAYRADVILCTVYFHLMEPEHGLFRPMDLISGPDALVAVAKLKNLIGP